MGLSLIQGFFFALFLNDNAGKELIMWFAKNLKIVIQINRSDYWF
jgi:hypothetical protein